MAGVEGAEASQRVFFISINPLGLRLPALREDAGPLISVTPGEQRDQDTMALLTVRQRRSRIRSVAVRAAATLAAVVLLAASIIYGVSEWSLRRRHRVPLERPPAPRVGAGADEGRRLAVLVGCLKGCHGPEGEGGEEAFPRVFSVTAPTLTAVLPEYSDAELIRLVRFGVKRDGTSAVGMPASVFYPMDGADLALILRHLRERPSLPAVPRHRRILPLGRLALLMRWWKISADQVDSTIPRWGELPRTTPLERGRYWASITCAECHGSDLEGLPHFPSPSLAIVNAYYPEQFQRLIRTGEHLSGRTDGAMARVSRAAFAEFTDQEIADLYAFLTRTFEGRRLGAP